MVYDCVLFVLTMEFGVVLVQASEDLHGHYVQTGSSHFINQIILFPSQRFLSELCINV